MDDFQKQALQPVAITDKTAIALAHRALGMSGEVGIVSNITKKIIRDRNDKLKDEDRELLKSSTSQQTMSLLVMLEASWLDSIKKMI